MRCIHLNPVRAGMVTRPEDYKYSSHRAYLGMEPAGIVDVDPVLRHFGAGKEVARASYRKFVEAGIKSGTIRKEITLPITGSAGKSLTVLLKAR